ncbi:unnamed protein product, partial [Aphanomyces euteiches]
MVLHDGVVLIQAVYRHTVPAPFHAFQRMDDNTLYRTLRLANATGEIHSNLVRKYYPEDDRDIVLWSSVLNDELIPHMDHGAVNNESGWLVVEAKDAHSCCIQTILHMVDTRGICGRLETGEIVVDSWNAMNSMTLLPRGQEPQPIQSFMAL